MKNMKDLSCHSQEWNWEPPEYRSDEVPAVLTCTECFVWVSAERYSLWKCI
jgi:hypothetical protein